MIILYRIVFVLAGLVFLLAIWQKTLQVFGYTISAIPYASSRILELAAILFLIVGTLLLRQVRDALRK